MSNIKFSPNLFLGSKELNRFKEFLVDSGFKKIFKAIISNYGVCYQSPSTLQVIEGSTGFVSIRPGFIIDSDLNVVEVENFLTDAIQIPDDNIYRFLSLNWVKSNKEIGIVDIGVDGSITGTGTKFLDVLRGSPSNAPKVRFVDSNNNIADYVVAEVLDDENAILNSVNLVAETGQKYAVVGAFSPNVVIKEENKLIYEYDEYNIKLSVASVVSGIDIVIARVKNNGGVLEIQDTRQFNKLKFVS